MTRHLPWLGGLLACWGLVGCADEPITQVVVWFDADSALRSEIDAVSVTIESDGVTRLDVVEPYDASAPKLPKIVLEPLRADASRRYLIHAEVSARGATLASLELGSGYVAGESLYARMIFEASCQSSAITREAQDLSRSRAQPTQLRGCRAGTAAAADGGSDAGHDAAPADDAELDAGPAPSRSEPCGPDHLACVCADGVCRPETACDRQKECEEGCELEGESYRCVCGEGGVPRSDAPGRCLRWRPRERVDVDNTGDVRYSNLAQNPAGVAVAVWFEQICPRPGCGSDVEVRLWANRYEPEEGWRGPRMLRARPEYEIEGFVAYGGSPAVAVDNEGNALVLWQEDATPDRQALHAALLPAEAWGGALELDSPGEIVVEGGQLERDPMGGFYFAATRGKAFDDFGWWIRRFTRAQGWEETLELSQPADQLQKMAFAVGASGELTFLWTHASGQVQTARFDPRGPQPLFRMLITDSARAAERVEPDVAVNEKGDAIAIWLQSPASGSQYELFWSQAFEDAGWWWEARHRASHIASLTTPVVAFDGSGRGTMAWVQSEGDSDRVYAMSLDQQPVMIDRQDVGLSTGVQLAGDARGNTLAIWARKSTTPGQDALWMNRLDAKGWRGPLPLAEAEDLVVHQRVTTSAEEAALVLWHGLDGDKFVLYARALQ